MLQGCARLCKRTMNRSCSRKVVYAGRQIVVLDSSKNDETRMHVCHVCHRLL